MTYLELLSPARNLECGIAAIDHGADAVYIGAPRFGARATAGNSLDDIHQLCEYAHRFSAKVYVTINTIVFDEELNDVASLINELRTIGVDALIVQDLAVADMARGMGLHASTQTDNRTAEKVDWLSKCGFSRVVLARELSVCEIADIHNKVPHVALEAFVHGALCVGYSGICYASQHCFNRSANRGECAQFCRLAFNLVDSEGKLIENNRHLLSLKDLCLHDNIGQMIEAGVTSFKIEGRLKDVDYVKNVTAAYSLQLDRYISLHPSSFRRSSLGKCQLTFTPNLSKTFNRGYTTYFNSGRQPDIFSPSTPKAIGEYVGKVKSINRETIVVSSVSAFSNGDGLCYFNNLSQLEGFRVNRAEGNRLYLQTMPKSIRVGMALYRNHDSSFDRILSRQSSNRRIPIILSFGAITDGFELSATVNGTDISCSVKIEYQHQQAQTQQFNNIQNQLSKLGNSVYKCNEFILSPDFGYFVPSSILSRLRRDIVSSLDNTIRSHRLVPEHLSDGITDNTLPQSLATQPASRLNISNKSSSAHYKIMGADTSQMAYEMNPSLDKVIMQCRHCIRYSFGYCVNHGGSKPDWVEPLYLTLPDGKRFRLHFDCKRCQMNIIATDK